MAAPDLAFSSSGRCPACRSARSEMRLLFSGARAPTQRTSVRPLLGLCAPRQSGSPDTLRHPSPGLSCDQAGRSLRSEHGSTDCQGRRGGPVRRCAPRHHSRVQVRRPPVARAPARRTHVRTRRSSPRRRRRRRRSPAAHPSSIPARLQPGRRPGCAVGSTGRAGIAAAATDADTGRSQRIRAATERP